MAQFNLPHYCAITGEVEGLKIFQVAELRNIDENELIIHLEWNWGLPIGGLEEVDRSPLSLLRVSREAWKLLATGQLVISPTLKMLEELKEFNVHNFCVHKEDERYPFSKLDAPVHRYVLLPVTDAARDFVDHYDFESQNTEDFGSGIDIVWNTPVDPISRSFPIIKCTLHPLVVVMLSATLLSRKGRLPTMKSYEWGSRSIVADWSCNEPPEEFEAQYVFFETDDSASEDMAVDTPDSTTGCSVGQTISHETKSNKPISDQGSESVEKMLRAVHFEEATNVAYVV